jgi:hypothetical protein
MACTYANDMEGARIYHLDVQDVERRGRARGWGVGFKCEAGCHIRPALSESRALQALGQSAT